MQEAPYPRSASSRRPMDRTGTPGIFKRGNRYVVVARDHKGKQVKRFTTTLAEARDVKATLRADVARGEYRSRTRITFAEYAKTWLDTYNGRTSRGIRESTMVEYRRAIEQRAIPFFGRLQLVEIEPRDVKRYLAEVAATGRSQNTIRLALAPVRALFATAVEEGVLRFNPATGVRLPRPINPKPEEEQTKALTEAELRRLLAEVAPEWRLLVRFIALTGLRIGEALALRWSDLDLGHRRLRVARRVYGGEFAPPKSAYGRRTVPITEALAQDLWQHRKDERPISDDALVFPGRAGEPVDPSTVFRAVRAAGKRSGTPWAGLHTLRHTCATMLFRNGLNAKQVQLWLGHHSPAFTLATYVHLLPDDLPSVAFLDAVVSAQPSPSRSNSASRPESPLAACT
jgi:integrase